MINSEGYSREKDGIYLFLEKLLKVDNMADILNLPFRISSDILKCAEEKVDLSSNKLSQIVVKNIDISKCLSKKDYYLYVKYSDDDITEIIINDTRDHTDLLAKNFICLFKLKDFMTNELSVSDVILDVKKSGFLGSKKWLELNGENLNDIFAEKLKIFLQKNIPELLTNKTYQYKRNNLYTYPPLGVVFNVKNKDVFDIDDILEIIDVVGEKITIKSPSYVDFGLLKDISPLLEKQYKEIVLLTISNFELFTSSEGYTETVRFDYLNSLMNFLFPPKFGDVANSNFTQERSYVNFNHLLMNKSQRKMLGYDLDSNKFKEHKDSGGFVVSFYCKYYNELVNSIKDDGGNVKKEKVNLILNFLEFAIETGINENYFTINTIQNIFELINKLKEVFPDTKSPLISISKSKYPETYSFLNTMINVVDFESFKYNDDLKTYYDRNDVILRYETLEAPKLVTKEELLKYLCLEE